MTPQIEIYVRPSGDKTHLNFYIPESFKSQFIQGLIDGKFECEVGAMNLELDVFPEHITDNDQRKRLLASDLSLHLRRGITAINIYKGD